MVDTLLGRFFGGSLEGVSVDGTPMPAPTIAVPPVAPVPAPTPASAPEPLTPLGRILRARPKFDPEGADYDYEAARAAGLKPDATGHWPSRDPNTGRILKGQKHPTYNLTVEEDAKLGYGISKGRDGLYYSKREGEADAVETPIGKLFGVRQPPASTPAVSATPPADTSLQPLALLESGYHALRAGIYGVGATANARNLDLLTKIDAGETVKVTDDPYGYRYMPPELRAKFKAQIMETQTSAIKGIVERTKKAAKAPIDPVVAAAMNAKGDTFLEGFEIFWDNFSQKPLKTIATIALQSAPQMVPGVAAAAIAGPVGGIGAAAGALGVGSFATDYAATVLSAMHAKGVNTADEAALAKAFSDPKLMESIQKQAFAHAAVVGTLDAASMGVAGKTLAPQAVRNMLARQAINVPAQTVVGGTLGATGEALGQVAAGQPLHAGQIASEFVGEFAFAPVEVATAALARRPAAETTLSRLMPELAVSETAITQAVAGQPGLTQPDASQLAAPPPTMQGELFGGAQLGAAPPIRQPVIPIGPQLQLPGIDPGGAAAVESMTAQDSSPQQLSLLDYLDAQRQYELPLSKLQEQATVGTAAPVLGGWHAVPRGAASPNVESVATAFDRVAAREHRGGVALSRVDLTRLDPAKISGSLLTLASETDDALPNTTGPNNLQGRARWLVKQVHQLFASERDPDEFVKLLDRYKGMYASLVAKGLRYLPSTNLNAYDSFVYSEPLPQDALVQSELPVRDPTVSEANRQYTLLRTDEGINRFVGRSVKRPGRMSIDDASLRRLDWTIDPIEFSSVMRDEIQFSLTWANSPDHVEEARDTISDYFRTADVTLLKHAISLGFRLRADDNIMAQHPSVLTVGRLPYDKLRVESLRIGMARTKGYRHAPWMNRETAIGVLNGAEVVPGQTYNFAAHKPGEVLVASSQPEDRPKLNQYAGLITKALTEFAPLHRVIFTSDPLVFGKDKDFGIGSFSLIAPELAVIYVSPATLHGTKDTLANVIWHELGHLIVFKHWDATEQSIKDRILFNYEVQLRAALFQSEEEFAPGFRAPSTQVRQLRSKTKAIDLLDRGDMQSVWYTFDEYLSEEIARWASSEQEPLSWTDRFIDGVARVLELMRKHLAQQFDVPLERLDATSDVAAWLDSVRTNNLLDETSVTQQSFVAGMLDTRDSNAEAEGDTAVPAAPVSGASQSARKLLRQAKLEAERETRRKLAGLDRYNKMIKHGWNLLQLATQNRHIAGLQQYVEMIDAWHNFKMRWMTQADANVRAWNQLSADRATAVGEFMFDLANMTYKGEKEAARWPTRDELTALVQKHKLNDMQFKVYLSVRDHFLSVLDQIERSLRKDATRLFGTGTARFDTRMKEIDQSMASLRAQPYFPFARFGDFVTIVRDTKRNKVYQQHYATRFAQRRDMARVRKLHPQHVYVQTKVPEEIKTLIGMPRIFIESVVDRLNLTPVQRRQVNDMLYELSPAQSFKKHFLQREGLAGYSRDAIRAYASYFFHGANHLARLEYGPLLDNAIKHMETEYKGLERLANVPPIIKRRGIIDFAKEHYNYIMAPESDWPALRSVAFQFYFAFNVKQALINLTQVPLVAYPFLAAQFNDVRAIRALAEGSAQLRNMYSGGAKNLTPGLARALSLAMEQGFIDESQAADLAGLSEGNTLLRNMPGNSVDRLIRNAGRVTTYLFQASEKINRRVVFRAGYTLGLTDPDGRYGKELQSTYSQQINELLNAGWSRVEAVAFAAGKDSVRRTQYEYARWAKPRFMRGPIRANLFTFFNYLQNTLWFAAHSPGNIRYLVLLLASAGLMGMPLASDAGDLAKIIAKLFLGKHFNIELELSKWLHTIGVERPDLILHGLGRESFGMVQAAEAIGLPMPRVDVSGSLSMGHVVPGLRQVADAVMGDKRPREMFGAGAQGVAGAAFNIPITLFTSAMSDNPDPQKRWEPAMPVFLRNLSKATRFWEEEHERSSSGAMLVPFSRNDPQQVMEIAAQAIGFQPTRLTEKWNTVRLQHEVQTYWNLRRQHILEHLHHERYVMKNMDGWNEHMDRLKKFNAEVPYKEFAINQTQLINSMRQREVRRIQEEYGLVGGRRDYRLNRDIEEVTRGANEPPRRPGSSPQPVHQQPVR